MSAEDLYRVYCAWEPGKVPRSMRQVLNAAEILDVTVEQSKTGFINRLYRVVPAYEGGRLGLFVYYEENVFSCAAEDDDDPELVETRYCVHSAD